MDLDGNGSESIVNEVVDRAWHFLGQIDALANHYAYESDITPLLDLTEEELEKIIRHNLKVTWLICKMVMELGVPLFPHINNWHKKRPLPWSYCIWCFLVWSE